MDSISPDPERQIKAKEYARIGRRLFVLEFVLVGAYTLAWLIFGWSVWLRDLLLTVITNPWLLVAGFGLVFGGIIALISLPLEYYEGFYLPNRYGLSTQSLKSWLIDQVKGGIIGVIFAAILIEAIYWILRSAPQSWWLWVGILLLLFTLFFSFLAPVLLFPLFNKFEPLGEQYRDLEQRLIHLAERANTHIKGVYQFDMSRRTTTANAALTGLGNTRRVILGDTLLTNYTADEIETVLAHELAHHVHRDIPVGILVQSVLTLGGLYFASLVLDWGVSYFGFYAPGDIATLPLFVLVMGLYGLVTMPLGNLYSRWREERADRYAIRMTGKGDAFASALVKLANQNLSDAEPEAWVEFLFYSHPALGKRIAFANASMNIIHPDTAA